MKTKNQIVIIDENGFSPKSLEIDLHQTVQFICHSKNLPIIVTNKKSKIEFQYGPMKYNDEYTVDLNFEGTVVVQEKGNSLHSCAIHVKNNDDEMDMTRVLAKTYLSPSSFNLKKMKDKYLEATSRNKQGWDKEPKRLYIQ